MKNNIQRLRTQCLNAKIFSKETLDWINQNNLWNIWVPKAFGGQESTFTKGLRKLQDIAKIDGSLGWTVTLCSGANYFIGNLNKEVAKEIFDTKNVCLGGSGGAFGTAEKIGNQYKIKGRWRYATGAPYLTHFTLNANIIENGEELKNEDGSPKILSFVIPKNKVTIIEDWNTMGLIATATHSFDVNDVLVNEKYSFIYNQLFHEQAIFKIPFRVFASLTVWVNYLGIAEHFLEEAIEVLAKDKLHPLSGAIKKAERDIYAFAEDVENTIANQLSVSESINDIIHKTASNSIRNFTSAIIEVYPFLGIKASREDHQLNQIFRDYFTATQHHIFVER